MIQRKLKLYYWLKKTQPLLKFTKERIENKCRNHMIIVFVIFREESKERLLILKNFRSANL